MFPFFPLQRITTITAWQIPFWNGYNPPFPVAENPLLWSVWDWHHPLNPYPPQNIHTFILPFYQLLLLTSAHTLAHVLSLKHTLSYILSHTNRTYESYPSSGDNHSTSLSNLFRAMYQAPGKHISPSHDFHTGESVAKLLGPWRNTYCATEKNSLKDTVYCGQTIVGNRV